MKPLFQLQLLECLLSIFGIDSFMGRFTWNRPVNDGGNGGGVPASASGTRPALHAAIGPYAAQQQASGVGIAHHAAPPSQVASAKTAAAPQAMKANSNSYTHAMHASQHASKLNIPAMHPYANQGHHAWLPSQKAAHVHVPSKPMSKQWINPALTAGAASGPTAQLDSLKKPIPVLQHAAPKPMAPGMAPGSTVPTGKRSRSPLESSSAAPAPRPVDTTAEIAAARKKAEALQQQLHRLSATALPSAPPAAAAGSAPRSLTTLPAQAPTLSQPIVRQGPGPVGKEATAAAAARAAAATVTAPSSVTPAGNLQAKPAGALQLTARQGPGPVGKQATGAAAAARAATAMIPVTVPASALTPAATAHSSPANPAGALQLTAMQGPGPVGKQATAAAAAAGPSRAAAGGGVPAASSASRGATVAGGWRAVLDSHGQPPGRPSAPVSVTAGLPVAPTISSTSTPAMAVAGAAVATAGPAMRRLSSTPSRRRSYAKCFNTPTGTFSMTTANQLPLRHSTASLTKPPTTSAAGPSAASLPFRVPVSSPSAASGVQGVKCGSTLMPVRPGAHRELPSAASVSVPSSVPGQYMRRRAHKLVRTGYVSPQGGRAAAAAAAIVARAAATSKATGSAAFGQRLFSSRSPAGVVKPGQAAASMARLVARRGVVLPRRSNKWVASNATAPAVMTAAAAVGVPQALGNQQTSSTAPAAAAPAAAAAAPLAPSRSYSILYKRQGNRLVRSGVRALRKGANLSLVQPTALNGGVTGLGIKRSPSLALRAAAAAAAAAAGRQGSRMRAFSLHRPGTSLRHSVRGGASAITASRSRYLAAKAAAYRRSATAPAPQRKTRLVRINGCMYHVLGGGPGAGGRKLQAVGLKEPAAAAAMPPATRSSFRTAQQSTAYAAASAAASRASFVRARALSTARLAGGPARPHTLPFPRSRIGSSTPQKPGYRPLYCPEFCRTGSCKKQQAGSCGYVHDPSKVAVCTFWLQGSCKNETSGCPLQHKLCPDLMPVCSYFLEGICSSDNCPYLHINYGPDAPPCTAFLHGYCPLGRNCPRRHISGQAAKEMRKGKWKAAQAEEPPSGASLKRRQADQGNNAKRSKRVRPLGLGC